MEINFQYNLSFPTSLIHKYFALLQTNIGLGYFKTVFTFGNPILYIKLYNYPQNWFPSVLI